jgi:hypothetical protein
LEIAFKILPETSTYTIPSRTTTKRWVQKVGYYKLISSKCIADDWMIITDASIQIGPDKCLIALGCRQANLPFKRPLKLDDLEVLGLRIVSSMKAKVVTDFLNEVKSCIGNIACITIDQGADILRGVKDFQLTNPEARYINGTAHRVANNLKACLENDERWKAFRVKVTQARRKMQFSSISGLLPPSPREKSRFMNIGPLIQWAVDMLILLNAEMSLSNLSIDEIKNQIGWLEYYRDDIEIWHQYSQIAGIARDCVRTEGIHLDIVDSFNEAIAHVKIGLKGLQFADRVSLFLRDQTNGMKPGECFIGSTEVIESLFGKIKYMEREQTAFGFTSIVLAGIACIGPTDDKTIADAVTSIKLKDIELWAGKEIKESTQSQRSKIRNCISKLKEKMGGKTSGILQGEAVGF